MTPSRWAQAWRGVGLPYAALLAVACGPAPVASRAAPETPAAVSPPSEGHPSDRLRLRVSLRPETSEDATRLNVSLTLWGADGDRTRALVLARAAQNGLPASDVGARATIAAWLREREPAATK